MDDAFWNSVSRAAAALDEREDASLDQGPWTDQGAVFSDDFLYRYRLWREWDSQKPTVAFVTLNPSIANARNLDPVTRRCIGFAKTWGFGRLEVLNAFGWVTTDPHELRVARPDGSGIFAPELVPIGSDNDQTIIDVCHRVDEIVVAWGLWAETLGRLPRLLEILQPFREKTYALGFSVEGHPRHPLLVPKDTQRVQYVIPSWHQLREPTT